MKSKTPRIFISYRREPDKAQAVHLHDKLAETFGDDNVFLDMTSLPIGQPFPQRIIDAINAHDVFLLLISKNTLDSRVQDPNDWVRLEIQEVLKSPSKRIIPILLDCTEMPSKSSLPPEIQDLADRSAEFLMSNMFRETSDRLIRKILNEPKHNNVPRIIIYTVTLFIFFLLGGLFFRVAADVDTASRFDFKIEPSSGRPGTDFYVETNGTGEIICQKLYDNGSVDPRRGVKVDKNGIVLFEADRYPGTQFEIICTDFNQLPAGEIRTKRQVYFSVTSTPTIKTPSFEIDGGLVTNAEFAFFVDSFDYRRFQVDIPIPGLQSRDQSPYPLASWLEAEAYCQWRFGYQVPTLEQILQVATLDHFIVEDGFQEWVRIEQNSEHYGFISYGIDREIAFSVENGFFPADPFVKRGFRCVKPLFPR